MLLTAFEKAGRQPIDWKKMYIIHLTDKGFTFRLYLNTSTNGQEKEKQAKDLNRQFTEKETSMLINL